MAPEILRRDFYRGKEVLKSEGLVNLVELEAARSLDALPSDAKRGLMKALVLTASSCEDQVSRDQFWQRVLDPLSTRYNSLINRQDLKKIYTDETVKRAFISIIESFIGEERHREVVSSSNSII